MKIIVLVVMFIYSITSFSITQDIMSELIDLGLNFIENPGDLFFNLQQDIEDCAPLPAGQIEGLKKKYFGFRVNLLPTFLPFTLGNIALKGRFNTETKYFPQIGVICGFGKILALNFIPNLSPKPQDNVLYYGLV
ncbi:MAG: hypothetical protein N2Z73_04665, partial [Endomicrobia bacterium]|nr:hypothetical protein [Endomicrobiia bacterium]